MINMLLLSCSGWLIGVNFPCPFEEITTATDKQYNSALLFDLLQRLIELVLY